MIYINKKTQAVLETACAINGGDWVLKDAVQPTVEDSQEKPQTKKTRKKSGEE